MPFLPGFEDEDEQQLLQQQQMVAPGAGNAPLSGSTGPSNKGGSKSGRWTNLDAYLEGNSEGAAQLGQNISSKVGQNLDKAEGSINAAKVDFEGQVGANKVTKDLDTLNRVQSNPLDVDKASFVRMRDAEYKGPMNLGAISTFQNADKDYSTAKSQAEAAQSESGRSTLINEFYNRPSYKAGENKLDQLLLQNNQQARDSFQGIQPRFSQIDNLLSDSKSNAESLAQAAQNETNEARSAARSAVDGSITGLQSALEEKLAQTRATGSTRRTETLDDVGDDRLREYTRNMSGLNEGSNLYDIDLKKYVGAYDPDKANLNNVTSQDEYAKYNALKELAGYDPAFIVDPEQVGTYADSFFDKDALTRDIQMRKADLDSHVSAIPGVAEQMAFAHNSVSTAFPAEWSQIKTPQDAINVLNSPTGQSLLQWSKDRAGTNAAKPMLQLEEWVNQYNKMNPNRVVGVE
jgi:hypothetical protein